jgi:hypothetical protein
MPMKNSNDTIGNRTRDLPACSAVPQPTACPPLRPPPWTCMLDKYVGKYSLNWIGSGRGAATACDILYCSPGSLSLYFQIPTGDKRQMWRLHLSRCWACVYTVVVLQAPVSGWNEARNKQLANSALLAMVQIKLCVGSVTDRLQKACLSGTYVQYVLNASAAASCRPAL